jgi:hypothetical protein
MTRKRDTSTSKLHFAPPVIYYLFRTSSYSFLGCKGHVFLLVYMEEIVPAMLRRVNENGNLVPLFVWSQRECESIQFEGGAPTMWGKPLRRVFD